MGDNMLMGPHILSLQAHIHHLFTHLSQKSARMCLQTLGKLFIHITLLFIIRFQKFNLLLNPLSHTIDTMRARAQANDGLPLVTS